MSTTWTKKELLAEIDYFLKEYVPGSKIFFTDKDAKRIVKILRSIDKWATSMNYSNHFVISWRMTKGRRYKCLEIKQHNGKKIPITKNAVKQLGNVKSKRAMVLEEMRKIIEPQIDNFRRVHFRYHGRSSKKFHVDHVEPFIKLACDFAVDQGWKNFDDATGRKTRGNRWIFEDDVKKAWYDYHDDKSELKVIDAEVNLAESAKGYSAPF